MNANTSPAESRPAPQSLPKTKPKITFMRLTFGIFTVLCIATLVFWFFNIRQPGVSYHRPDVNEPAATTPAALQQTVPTEPVASASQTEKDESEKPLTTATVLEKHVVHLATTIGERNLRTYDKLCEAADYIEAEFKSYGYKPVRQTYQVHGKDCFNIDVEIKGSTLPNEVIIIGAHYDSVVGTPGANDNGSGTAAMLLLAKHFAKSAPQRSLRFVAWTNEEPPYFQNRGLMGSWVYAEKCRVEKARHRSCIEPGNDGLLHRRQEIATLPAPAELAVPVYRQLRRVCFEHEITRTATQGHQNVP